MALQLPSKSSKFWKNSRSFVKAFKSHLKRIADTCLLMIEEMQTLTVQIESILNSRPLTSLSNEPNDLSYLSSGHFLIGDALTIETTYGKPD